MYIERPPRLRRSTMSPDRSVGKLSAGNAPRIIDRIHCITLAVLGLASGQAKLLIWAFVDTPSRGGGRIVASQTGKVSVS